MILFLISQHQALKWGIVAASVTAFLVSTNHKYCIHARRRTVHFQPGRCKRGGWAKYQDIIHIALCHIWQQPLGQTGWASSRVDTVLDKVAWTEWLIATFNAFHVAKIRWSWISATIFWGWYNLEVYLADRDHHMRVKMWTNDLKTITVWPSHSDGREPVLNTSPLVFTHQ